MDDILKNAYYNPSIQATSVNRLYQLVKKEGVTQKQVKEFIEKQEAHQLFKKPRVVNYFPIYASHSNEIFQVDLMDVSNLAGANRHVKYLLTCIDVYSRFAYVVPITNKEASTVSSAMQDILRDAKPEVITTDIGSEYISRQFEELLRKHGIKHVKVPKNDHKRLANVDRFIRTLRSKMENYLTMYNTTKYIDVLPMLVKSYNAGYHSGIKNIPENVGKTDDKIDKMLLEKYLKAKQTEVKYDVGQKVRHLLNLGSFHKKTEPRFSKTIHTIISKNAHSYKIDNGNTYKFYELEPADVVETVTSKPASQPTREELKKTIHVKRQLNKEGVSLSDITTARKTRAQQSEYVKQQTRNLRTNPKKTDKFHY